jgi:hypothetical protein
MATLGYIGERLDLLIRQGATFGPFDVTLANPDKSPVDLSGASLRAHIRKKALDTNVVISLQVELTDPALGKFKFGLTDEFTAGITAGESVKDHASLYVWDMEMEDSLGRVSPLYYGEVKVFREVTRLVSIGP